MRHNSFENEIGNTDLEFANGLRYEFCRWSQKPKIGGSPTLAMVVLC